MCWKRLLRFLAHLDVSPPPDSKFRAQYNPCQFVWHILFLHQWSIFPKTVWDDSILKRQTVRNTCWYNRNLQFFRKEGYLLHPEDVRRLQCRGEKGHRQKLRKLDLKPSKEVYKLHEDHLFWYINSLQLSDTHLHLHYHEIYSATRGQCRQSGARSAPEPLQTILVLCLYVHNYDGCNGVN